MRMYIGLWLFVIALLVASIEGSVFIKVFTRFTEEIFSSLISLLYIYESVSNLLSVSISDVKRMKLGKRCFMARSDSCISTCTYLGVQKTSADVFNGLLFFYEWHCGSSFSRQVCTYS